MPALQLRETQFDMETEHLGKILPFGYILTKSESLWKTSGEVETFTDQLYLHLNKENLDLIYFVTLSNLYTSYTLLHKAL